MQIYVYSNGTSLEAKSIYAQKQMADLKAAAQKYTPVFIG